MTLFGEKTILFSVFDAQDITDNDLAFMGSKIPKYRVEKAERYRRRADRINCVTAYFLVGYVLKKYFSATLPERPVFNKYGKPVLEDPGIDFSVSHCRDAVCGGVTAFGNIGADAEMKVLHFEDLADHVLSKNEKALYRVHPDPGSFFTEAWTKKEAYLKMLGTGIRDDLFLIDTTAFDAEGAELYVTTRWYKNVCISTCASKKVIMKAISVAELINSF